MSGERRLYGLPRLLTSDDGRQSELRYESGRRLTSSTASDHARICPELRTATDGRTPDPSGALWRERPELSLRRACVQLRGGPAQWECSGRRFLPATARERLVRSLEARDR